MPVSIDESPRKRRRAFYVMDRAYLDFERLYALAAFGAFFVIRGKVQHAVPASVLSAGRQDDRSSL